MACSYNRVALPMTYLLPRLNMQGSIAQGPSVGDLSSAIPSTRVTFPLLLLAAQVLPKRTALRFVCINMLVKRFMTDGQFGSYLFGTPLNLQQSTGLFTYPGCNGWRIATVLCSLYRELTGLFWAITPRASVAIELPADGGLVPVKQQGYLRLIVSSFHESVNLISFSLAEVFVFHKQLRLPGQEALNAIHPQPPNHQLIKVALRA